MMKQKIKVGYGEDCGGACHPYCILGPVELMKESLLKDVKEEEV